MVLNAMARRRWTMGVRISRFWRSSGAASASSVGGAEASSSSGAASLSGTDCSLDDADADEASADEAEPPTPLVSRARSGATPAHGRRYTMDVERLMHGLSVFERDRFRLTGIERVGIHVFAHMRHDGRPYAFDYNATPRMIRLTSSLAVDMRGLMGHNVYFDVVQGVVTIHVRDGARTPPTPR